MSFHFHFSDPGRRDEPGISPNARDYPGRTFKWGTWIFTLLFAVTFILHELRY